MGGDFCDFVSTLCTCKISIHTTHVGGDPRLTAEYNSLALISIHTTHVGGDFLSASTVALSQYISIHTTHVGGDLTLLTQVPQ